MNHKNYIYTIIVAFNSGSFQQTQIEANNTSEALLIYHKKNLENKSYNENEIVSITFAERIENRAHKDFNFLTSGEYE